MSRIVKVFIPAALLFLQLLYSTVSAATYYVSPSGDDGNSGLSEEEPFRVLQQAVDTMKAKDTLVVLDGVYTGKLKLKSGITIRAKNPRKVVFSGAEPVKGEFVQHAGGIYKLAVSGKPKQLFYKNKPMTWARWPNLNWSENWIRGRKWISGQARPGELRTASFSRIKDLDLTGGYCFLRYSKGNSCYSRSIKSFDGTVLRWDDTNFYNRLFTGEDGKHGSPREFAGGKKSVRGMFFLAGDLDLLDIAGEWFEQDGTLYFFAPGGVAPQAADVWIKTNDYSLYEEGLLTDLKIEGIDFFATSVRLENPQNRRIIFRDVHFTYIGAEPLFIDKLKGKRESKPIRIAGSLVAFDKCLFAGAHNGALQLLGSTHVVRNCVFAENNRHANFESTALFMVPSGPFKVTRNTFFNNCSDAIRIDFPPNYTKGENPEVSYNNICNAGLYNPDVSGAYFPNMTQHDTEFHHNWVHNVNGNGVRLDQAGEEFTVHHNVFWSSKRGMSIEGYGKFNVYNNTSVRNREACELIRNVVAKTKGSNPAMISNELSFPPIDDWLVLNNLVAKFADNVGPSEKGPFEQAKAKGILHPERSKRKSLPVKDRGYIRGNLTGFKMAIFKNGNLDGLNLIPADERLKTSLAQSEKLKARGVTGLGSYQGAYDYQGKIWSAGSDWMPYDIKVPQTMAQAEKLARSYRSVSLVPEVKLTDLPR